MAKNQIKNTSSSAIKFTLRKEASEEEHLLLSGQVLQMDKLAGSYIEFFTLVDISFRQKKQVINGLNINKVVKDTKTKVKSLELPAEFIELKVKNVH